MNTATQLLARCNAYIKGCPWEPPAWDSTEHPDKLQKDIEAYLAKQQVEQEPVAMRYKEPENNSWNYCSFKGSKLLHDTLDKDPLYTSSQARKPLSDEHDSALCEALCNAASDEYFLARPQLESVSNRRIFYAGHRKAWITKDSAIEARRSIGIKP
jgi:hypothetical protein